MKALVCLNGKAPGKRLLLRCARESDRVFCADGALHYLLKNGILPDAWLGDLDSVSPDDRAYAERAGLQATVFPVRKDFTDGQLVVRQAIREGADEILLLGAFGGRSDHFLANLRLLYDTVRAGVRITALSEREQIRVETGTVCFEARSGRLVSLLPFTDELTVQKTEGFLYPLRNHTFSRRDQFALSGVSNELTAEQGSYVLSSGYGLFIQGKSQHF